MEFWKRNALLFFSYLGATAAWPQKGELEASLQPAGKGRIKGKDFGWQLSLARLGPASQGIHERTEAG